VLRIHLLDRQLRDDFLHALAHLWWESGIAEGLDEERWTIDGEPTAFDQGEFVVIVGLAGAVPVYYSIKRVYQ
jgi:hypothetical protein